MRQAAVGPEGRKPSIADLVTEMQLKLRAEKEIAARQSVDIRESKTVENLDTVDLTEEEEG